MNILNETFELNNGIKIPKIALGTWQVSNDDVVNAVKDAVDLGYRHIDTAVQYENEEGIGKAIKELSIPREELFITTKIPHDVKDYESTLKVINESLERLDLDYIDLLLIHSPKPWEELFAGTEKTYYEENIQVWKAMEKAYKDGKVKSIGVSNFEINDIKNIIDNSEIKPQVEQVRVHIGHTPTELIKYCEDNSILVEAYSPNATGKLLNNELVKSIADKYNVSVPQLSIKYDLQLGVLPLPKSTHKEHIKQNAELDFVISEEDMKELSKVPDFDIIG